MRVGKDPEDEMQALWLRYQETGDAQLRNRLVMAHLPMVQYIVAKKVRELHSRSNRRGLRLLSTAPRRRAAPARLGATVAAPLGP